MILHILSPFKLSVGGQLALSFLSWTFKGIPVEDSFVQDDTHRVRCVHEVTVVMHLLWRLDL